MLTEKAGENAGLIWNALDGKEGLTFKEIKKETKQKNSHRNYQQEAVTKLQIS